MNCTDKSTRHEIWFTVVVLTEWRCRPGLILPNLHANRALDTNLRMYSGVSGSAVNAAKDGSAEAGAAVSRAWPWRASMARSSPPEHQTTEHQCCGRGERMTKAICPILLLSGVGRSLSGLRKAQGWVLLPHKAVQRTCPAHAYAP